VPYNGVVELLDFFKKNEIKCHILTNFTSEHQHEKINKLNLSKYFDIIVCSEEVGAEKPSRKVFLEILDKVSCPKDKIIFIGDDYKNDILGAKSIGLCSFWKTKQTTTKSDLHQFVNFEELLSLFEDVDKELTNLQSLSFLYGSRFDLTQARSGNISCKVRDLMVIKSSGEALSEVTKTSCYSIIDNKALLADLNSNSIKNITDYNVFVKERASIETYMHSILKKYTVHIHPIQVNKILVSNNSRQIIKSLFPYSCFVDYASPGIDLFRAIKDQYKEESVIFLQNHGIIVTSDCYSCISSILNDVLNKCEQFLNEDYSCYKNVSDLGSLMEDVFGKRIFVKYVSKIDAENLNDKTFFPDKAVVCGESFSKLRSDFKKNDLVFFKETYQDHPKVIILNNYVYVCNKSLNACRDTEDVLLAHFLISSGDSQKNEISVVENQKLNSLECEIFRKTKF
jgi:hypothetical protein